MPVGIMNDEVAKAALSEGHNAAALNRKAFRKAGRQAGRERREGEGGCVCVCWGGECGGVGAGGFLTLG